MQSEAEIHKNGEWLRRNYLRSIGERNGKVDEPEPEPIKLENTVTINLGGIGDTLCAIAAAAGLGGKIILKCPKERAEWAALFADVVIEDHKQILLQDYGATGKEKPRWEWWANQIGSKAVLPPEKPLPKEALDWAIPYAGRVVIAPFAKHENRTWPKEKWIEVERLLTKLGLWCVILGDYGEDLLTGFKSDKIHHGRPANVAAVIKYAAAFAGNDSGMAHVAGFLRTPGVAVCSHESDNAIMGLYPTIRELGGRYQGFDKVTPEQVVSVILDQMHSKIGDFPIHQFKTILSPKDSHRWAEWMLIYTALWNIVREVNPKTIVEIGTRAGYSAWTMLQACPQAKIEAFDINQTVHGGYEGAYEHAMSYLPKDRFHLTIQDSHTIDRLPKADMAYIDGDHTEEGAYLDMVLAEKSGIPVLLVDDYTNLREVRSAVDRFAAERKITPTYTPNRTGHALLRLASSPTQRKL